MVGNKLTKILLVVLAIGLVFYFGLSFYVAYAMTSPLALRLENSPEVISKKYEYVSFQATDGVVLKGWLFQSSSENLVIMVAGLLPNRTNVEYLAPMIAKELLDKDYSVLMYDTMAHGLSGGKRVGFGSVEGRDVLGAVGFAKQSGFAPENIGIVADSTGAISTLMVIDQLQDIGPIVIDSAATSFQPIISDRLWKEKRIPPFFHPAIFFFDKIFFGVDLSTIQPIDKLKLVQERKFLFLHGAKDETIPVKNSQDLLSVSNKESKLVVFKNGSHIETYKSDPDLYRKEVYGFLEKELQD